jgi:hypothetical protein
MLGVRRQTKPAKTKYSRQDYRQSAAHALICVSDCRSGAQALGCRLWKNVVRHEIFGIKEVR